MKNKKKVSKYTYRYYFWELFEILNFNKILKLKKKKKRKKNPTIANTLSSFFIKEILNVNYITTFWNNAMNNNRMLKIFSFFFIWKYITF